MKIDEILNGVKVEWKKLGEVCISLPKGTLKTTQLLDDGYPVINSGRDLYGYYSQFNNEKNAFTIAARGEYAGFINFMSSRFWAGGLCYPYRSKDENKLLTKFIFYFLKRQEQNIMDTLVAKGSIPAINKSDCDKIQIPVPPLEIQEKIAKTLDKFTNYATELQTELQLRTKQYEYYRNLLLSKNYLKKLCLKFGENSELKTATLGKIVKLKNGKDWKNLNNGKIPVYGSGGKMDVYVDKFSYDKPTVLIPRKGSIENIFYIEVPFWNVDTIFYTEINNEKVLPKYFYYYMTNYDLKSLSINPTRPSLNQSILNKIEIILPPLDIQNEVVRILDKFSEISSNLEKGLPKEIDLRQKEYEFYRDRLLNFKKD